VIVIGGGSVLDAAGFAASLVHRGLRVVRVPTTVAAQNDVGVGVKTGVDAFGAKNFIGTFAPPFAVLNDFDFLDRLPHREWIAGISEAFKVALIKDKAFFTFLCRQAAALNRGARPAMERLVVRCARLHLDHIRRGGDPFETGSARPLDFGHWSAHHLEVMSGYRLRHGEAVAIGIALDMVIAWRLGFVTRTDLDALLAGLTSTGLPVWTPWLETRGPRGRLEILDGLEAFREHLGGDLSLSLPLPVGRCTEIHTLRPTQVTTAIRYLKHAYERPVIAVDTLSE
jgi:3-dehydroquinate synthase